MQQSVAQAAAQVELDRLAALCSSLRLYSNSDDDIAERLLEPIASMLGADAAAYRYLHLQHPRPKIEKLTSIGVASSVSDDYLLHFHHFDPFLDSLCLHSNVPDSREDFQRYYHDFLYPNGLVRHTGFMISDPGRQHAWVFNFHRPASAPEFSALEQARSRLIEACLQGQASGVTQIRTLPRPPEAGALCELTSREREIVIAVAQGFANKQIAASLAISPRTVENHLRNIYEKLHINTRTQLLSILYREHYTSDGEAAE